MKFTFSLDTEKLDIIRDSYNLTDVFSEIGGILKIITLVISILLSSYSK